MCIYVFSIFSKLAVLQFKGAFVLWLHTWTSGRGLDAHLCWESSRCPWAGESTPPMSQPVTCRIHRFYSPCCNTSATSEEKVPIKWDLDLVSSSRHSTPLSSSLADTGALKKQSSCWWGGGCIFLMPMPVLCLGAAEGLLKVQKASWAVPWHFGSLLPLPTPHFEVSSAAEEMTQLPMKLYQNHVILQPSVNQLCLQFTFICQPKTVPVLSHCLINF